MNRYNDNFSEIQYNIWHYNDVKKFADKALADDNKELYKFLAECLHSQFNFKPCLKVGIGEATGQGCSTL